MSDWEIVDNQINESAQPASDWSIVENIPDEKEKQPEENLGASVIKAPFRVGEDVLKNAYSFAKNIPTYYESAKTSIPGAIETIKNDPISALKQGLAGSQEAINTIAQMPSNIANYTSKGRLNLLPESVANFIKNTAPEDTTEAINSLFGQPKNEGEGLIRGIVRNIPETFGGAKLASTINPMQLTSKNIANNIVKTEKAMKEKYSGPEGLYNKLSDEASARGITGANISPNSNDLAILQKDMPEDEFVAINKLLQNKNITNAQNAISQLGFRQRKLESKFNRGDILTDPEKDLLKAVKNTKNHIQENMFMDNAGKIHEDLLNKHKKIQQGYANEVIPYTKNRAIQAYKKNEKLPNELVNSLSRGKFAAKRGSSHPAIGIKNKLTPTWNKLGVAGLLKILYDNMMGEPPSNTNKLGQ